MLPFSFTMRTRFSRIPMERKFQHIWKLILENRNISIHLGEEGNTCPTQSTIPSTALSMQGLPWAWRTGGSVQLRTPPSAQGAHGDIQTTSHLTYLIVYLSLFSLEQINETKPSPGELGFRVSGQSHGKPGLAGLERRS